MWRLRACSLNNEQLGIALGVSSNAVRNRRSKPDLWKLSDVERLATHFALPVTAYVQLNQALVDMHEYLKTVPNDQRRKVERLLLIKTNQLDLYNQSDWPVRQLLKMQQGLTRGNQ
jgi:hypothetical protein